MPQTPTQRSDRPAAGAVLALASMTVAAAGSVIVSRLPSGWDVLGVAGLVCAAFVVGLALPPTLGGGR